MGQRTVEQLNVARAHGAHFDLVTESGAAPSVAEATFLLAAPNPMLPTTMELSLYQLRQLHVICNIQYGPQHTKTLAYAAFIERFAIVSSQLQWPPNLPHSYPVYFARWVQVRDHSWTMQQGSLLIRLQCAPSWKSSNASTLTNPGDHVSSAYHTTVRRPSDF
jgi:hypothetical protein